MAEALEWHDALTSAARLFPVCLATFVATGSYMLAVAHARLADSAYAVAGLVGAALLLGSSLHLAAKARSLRSVLARMAERGADRPVPPMVPPPLVVMLPPINSGIAIGVAFDMVTKPASIAVALAPVAIGIAVGAASAMRSPAPVARPARAETVPG